MSLNINIKIYADKNQKISVKEILDYLKLDENELNNLLINIDDKEKTKNIIDEYIKNNSKYNNIEEVSLEIYKNKMKNDLR